MEEVRTVPRLSAAEMLDYFDQVKAALCNYLSTLMVEGLEQPPPGWPKVGGVNAPESIYLVILMFLMNAQEHLGEIKALKAIWGRN
jgi:hypothetical protein